MAFKFNPITGQFNIVNSSSGSNSFTIMQPPLGTSPTASSATDTLTFASSDSSVTITGNSGTKTLDFKAASPGNFNPVNTAAVLFDDFAYTVINKTSLAPMGPFNLITSNSNNAFLDLISAGENNRTGVINLTNDATHAETGLYGDVNAVKFANGTIVAATAVYLPTIPNNSTNNWDFVWGYSHTWPNIGDGPVFAVSPGVSTTFWSCLCYAAGAPTIVITTIPFVAATWYNLRIQINAAGTSVTYFINGTLVATIATNISTSVTGLGYRTLASTANATNVIRIDWLYQSFTPSAARGTF
jgi:hypothetical protein